jgi:hypothetical protein
MTKPTIRQTHAICESLNARAAIILAFSEDCEDQVTVEMYDEGADL